MLRVRMKIESLVCLRSRFCFIFREIVIRVVCESIVLSSTDFGTAPFLTRLRVIHHSTEYSIRMLCFDLDTCWKKLTFFCSRARARCYTSFFLSSPSSSSSSIIHNQHTTFSQTHCLLTICTNFSRLNLMSCFTFSFY